MSTVEIGILSFFLLILLLFLKLPVGANFFLIGFFGLTAILSFDRAVSVVGQSLFYVVGTPSWGALPLFILLGSIASSVGFAESAFKGINKTTHGLPGALGVTTCLACAAFGAISGSTAASAAVFSKLVYPEMKKYGYDKAFAAGTIASAGTFASMIPPSGLMIFYCLLTDQSIGRLFAAGIVPGLLTAAVYSLSIIFRVKFYPKLVKIPEDQRLERFTLKDRIVGIVSVWPMLLVSIIMLGGIYSGILTPIEAAAAGISTVIIIAVVLGKFKDKTIRDSMKSGLKSSASITSMMMVLLIGSLFFSRYFAFTRVPTFFTNWLVELDLPNIAILSGIMIIWFILGMLLAPSAIMALTIPLVFPIILYFGYDPIWFGILTIKMSEIASVTPPVGSSLFIISAVVGKDIKISQVYRGIYPYVLCDIFVLILMILFPKIVLWLPNLLFR